MFVNVIYEAAYYKLLPSVKNRDLSRDLWSDDLRKPSEKINRHPGQQRFMWRRELIFSVWKCVYILFALSQMLQ